MTQVIFGERKSAVLTPSSLACLSALAIELGERWSIMVSVTQGKILRTMPNLLWCSTQTCMLSFGVAQMQPSE
jgi:hypothetical protein